MALLKSLYERSSGCTQKVNYDSILDRFRCVSYNVSYFDDPRLFTCSFAKKPEYGHVLASTRENGEVVITDTRALLAGSSNYYRISKTHDNAVYSIAWSGMDMKLVTASGDHSARLWNVNDDGQLVSLDSFAYHGMSIKTVSFKQHNSFVFATGGYDGNIFVWDMRTTNRTPDQHIFNCHGDGTISCLQFQDEVKIISCGNKDSCIKVWDLRKTYLRTCKKPKPLYEIRSPREENSKGYSHLMINEKATRLYARCFDSHIYRFNVVNYPCELEATYVGHDGTDRYDKISLSPDERYLASTGMDGDDARVFIWRTDFPKEPQVKFGSEQLSGLSDISWCPEDELVFATSSDDPLPWIWSVPTSEDTEQSDSKTIRENSTIPSTYVRRLHVRREASKRVSAMAKSFERLQKPLSELGPLPTLPNGYQLHVCAPIPKRKQISWLASRQVKEKEEEQKQQQQQSQQQQQEEEVMAKKSTTPKRQRKSNSKRKSSVSVSPLNNLDRYFKRPKVQT